jgi:hypothetical protein
VKSKEGAKLQKKLTMVEFDVTLHVLWACPHVESDNHALLPIKKKRCRGLAIGAYGFVMP